MFRAAARIVKGFSGLFRRGASSMAERIKKAGKIGRRPNIKRTITVNEEMDSKTCAFCRQMHGRKLTVTSKEFDVMMQAPEMNKENKWGRQSLIPPYHPNCRGRIEVTYAEG